MLNYLWLGVKRAAVLMPGILVAYASARAVFPYFHQRLPLAVAIVATYGLGAYVLIPAILRLWRIFVPANHLPLYSVTPDGFASDPLNIGIIGSRTQLIAAMEAAGWSVAQPSTIRNIIATCVSIVFNHQYAGMPMSRLYLFGRKQDIGFELQEPDQKRGYRHHVRFWATTLDDIQSLPDGKITSRKNKLFEDRLLWAGAASLDIGITLMRQNFQLAHAVDPNTNRERDLIVEQLTHTGDTKLVETVRLHKAYSLINRTWFATLKTDGNMAVLQLK